MDIAAPRRTRPSSRRSAASTPRMARIDAEALRLLLDQAPDAILIYDPDRNRIIDGNCNAERLFECSHAELLRSAPGRVFGGETPDRTSRDDKLEAYEHEAMAGRETCFEWPVVGAAG